MVIPELIAEVNRIIDSLETEVREKVERGEGQLTVRTAAPGVETTRGPSIYSDALEAIVFCRGAANQATTAQEELGYLLDVMQALERTRLLYVETSADEGGYGNATFHMIIREILALYGELEAIAESIETQRADLAKSIGEFRHSD